MIELQTCLGTFSLVKHSIASQFYVFAEFKEVVNDNVFGEQCTVQESNNVFESNKTFEDEDKCQTSYLSDVDIDFYEVIYYSFCRLNSTHGIVHEVNT